MHFRSYPLVFVVFIGKNDFGFFTTNASHDSVIDFFHFIINVWRHSANHAIGFKTRFFKQFLESVSLGVSLPSILPRQFHKPCIEVSFSERRSKRIRVGLDLQYEVKYNLPLDDFGIHTTRIGIPYLTITDKYFP